MAIRRQGKGVNLLSTPPTRVHTLGYADDLSLTDTDDEAGTDRTTHLKSIRDIRRIQRRGGHESEDCEDQHSSRPLTGVSI